MTGPSPAQDLTTTAMLARLVAFGTTSRDAFIRRLADRLAA